MTTITPQNPFETQGSVNDIPTGDALNCLLAPELKLAAESQPRASGTTNSPPSITTSISEQPRLPSTMPVIPKKNNLGLSELSKQLRALQAKNEGQAVEIDRLERQLRILADTQGISVSDIRKALSDACKSEAYGELQHRVAALQAQLEAASASKQTVEQGSAAHQVANLQLRVGELEEVEQNLRSQINGMFESLKDQTANASRFESTCNQQQLEIDRLKEALQAAQQQQAATLIPAPVLQAASQQQAVPLVPTSVTGIVPAVPTLLHSQQQLVPAPPSAIVASPADIELLAETARLAKVEAQVQHDKLTISEQQLEAIEKQYKLRQAQFKARSMVQEERIQDLEQQLSSLYVAFELLRQEHSEDEVTRAALQTSLNDADSRVAQQVSEHDMLSPRHVEAVPVPASPDVVRSPPPPPVTPQYVPASPMLPLISYHSEASQLSHLTPINQHASVTSQSSPLREDAITMGGVLLLKGSNILRQWKKKHATLYQNFSNFQLVLSDVTSAKADKTYVLEVGVSTIHRYATQRYAFIIRVDPYDKEAPVIFAAAQNEKEYQQWMSALKLATTGNEYNPHDYNIGYGESHTMGSSAAEDQESSDLEVALRLSTQQM